VALFSACILFSFYLLLLQLISNDTFVSVYHRVLLSYKGPIISVASFFVNSLTHMKFHRSSAIYRDTSIIELMAKNFAS